MSRPRIPAAALALLAATPALHAQVYQFSYGTRTCNVFVPETVDATTLRAVLLFSNGSGENRQYMPQMPWVQEFARAHRVAVIGHSGSNLGNSGNAATTTTNVEGILAAATTVSGRASLANAPLLLAGMSSGGIASSTIGLQLPARTLGFAAWRGTQNNPAGISAASAEPISMSYVGEIDGNPTTNPGNVQTHFNNYRALATNTGRFAFPTTWNAGHDDSMGMSWDLTAIHLGEALRLRHPGTTLSTTPATYPTLNVVPFNDGFLAERAIYGSGTTLLNRPAFPGVYPANNYTGTLPATAAQASWLPSAYMALAYQTYTSTDVPGLARKGTNLANALQIESPARFQALTTDDSTEIVVNTREWRGVAEMSFYLDGTLLGTRTDGDWRWPLASLTAGHHSAIVVARDAAGNQRGAISAFSVIAPPTSGNTFNGIGGANLGTSSNWSLGTASWASRQQSASWETKTETKSALFFNGASASGQYALSINGFANTPLVHGLVFQSAPGANGFTLTTGQNLYLAYAGIRNLDDSTQTLRVNGNEGLNLVGSQTWAALGGDLVVSPVASDARITLSNPNDPWSPTTSDLTLHAATGRTVTISTPIRYFGSVIKEGPGLAVLGGVHRFADNFYGWRPVVGDTLAVMRGTLRLGPTADFIQDAGDFYATPTGTARTLRAYIADRPDAVLDVNNRPLHIASLNGGGQLSLGQTGTLTLSNQYEFGAIKLASGTHYRGSISGGTAGQTTLTHTAARTWNSRDGSSPPAALNFDLTLSGNSSFLGHIALVGANTLNIGHGNALGATGPGNETVIPSGSLVQLIGANMTVPEDFTFNTAANAVALANASAKFTATSGADVSNPTPAAGSNTLSGILRFPTVLSTGADSPALLVNESPHTTLTLAGTLTGQDWTSGGTGKTRLVLSATAAGTHFTVPGLIADGASSALALTLQKSGAASPTFRISGLNTYTGGTTISGGTLLALNPSGSATGPGALTVASGASLGGTGTISGPVTLQSGAGLAFTLATTPAAHAKLNLGSTLAFSGASTLAIVAPAGATPGTYPLLTATGGITGTLPTLSLPSGWSASLQSSSGTLNLVVTAVAAPTAPAAPSGLSATTSGTSIILSWIDNATNESGFKLQRSPNGSTGWTEIATPATDATTYTDPGLAAASTYFYRVLATNAGGDSAPSSVASATTTGVPSLPAAPTGLAVAPASASQLTVSWTDNATNESGDKVERSPNGTTGWVSVGNPGANATAFSDSGLTASTTYFYRVRATNSAGDSAYTSVASGTTNAPPAPPSAPSGLAATANSTAQITVTWTDTSATETGFTLERSPNGSTGWTLIASLAANVTTYIDTGLSASTTYHYRVRASNLGGDSAYSATTSATTLAAVQLIAQPFADASGTAAGSLGAITGVTSTSGVGSVQDSATLAYPGVLSSGRGFATAGGRFFMTLNTALPALSGYVANGRIGGANTGVLYVSWLARGLNANEANSVEFRTGTAADSDIVINIGTTFGNNFIRAMSATALNGGIANYNTSNLAPSAGVDLYVAKFTFGAGATTRVDVFVNQTTEGSPTVTTTGYGQFNVIGFAKFGGASAPALDEIRFAATYADAVPLQPAAPAPALDFVTPSTGPAAGGTTLTLTGANFTGATSVTVGGIAATNLAVVNATTITVTTPAGSHGPAALVVTTPAGTATLPAAFTYLTALQSWFSGYGLPTNGTGSGSPAADPDGDGVANLLEYALATSPVDPADYDNPVAEVSAARLQLAFLRARADVTYLVESSSDLTTWAIVPYTPVALGQTQTVTDPEPVFTAIPPRRFLRLRVTSP